MNTINLSLTIIAYLLVGLFVSMVQAVDINDSGKRLLHAWETIVLWPRILFHKHSFTNK